MATEPAMVVDRCQVAAACVQQKVRVLVHSQHLINVRATAAAAAAAAAAATDASTARRCSALHFYSSPEHAGSIVHWHYGHFKAGVVCQRPTDPCKPEIRHVQPHFSGSVPVYSGHVPDRSERGIYSAHTAAKHYSRPFAR
jgi:hypothetical protein